MSEILTNAAQLRNRFKCRLTLFCMRAAEAKRSYAEIRTQHSKHVHELNRCAAITVIACYGDATNMTFEQARIALDVDQVMLDKLP